MDNLIKDIRYGIASLMKVPGFTTVVVITLSLGIGANTAIFSVINGVLLRPLPFTEPDRLVMIWTDNPRYQLGIHELPAANADLPEWRTTATSFEQLAAFTPSLADLSDNQEPERVGGVDVSSNLLPVLGVQPLLGRPFFAEEEQPGKDRVAIVSYDLWQRRYGGDSKIVGKTIYVNQTPRTVIGVMPEGFSFPRSNEMPLVYNLPQKTELWMPMARETSYWQDRVQRQPVMIIGRLKAGVTQPQAQAEMDAIAVRQAMAYPDTHEGWHVWLTPLFNQIVSQTRTPLLVLLGAVGFLLLIVCANVASLLLVRAAGRRHEMAVRGAMGAGRGRIMRQLLIESLLLSGSGGVGGLLLGNWLLNFLLSLVPPNVPRLHNVSLDTHVLLFTALSSIVTGILFGLAPAWHAAKVDLVEALKDAGRSNSRQRGIRSHSILVTAEVALVTILLVGSALMFRSLGRLLAVDPGFSPHGVTAFDISLPWSRYSEGVQRATFFEQARSKLSSLPGVHAVGVVSKLPLSGTESMNWFAVEGAPSVPRGKEPVAEDRLITPGYFQAMSISLLRGRDFDTTDTAGKPLVAIVNETMARQFFPDGDAVGKRVKWVLDDKGWRTIVGIVRDVRSFALDVQPRPQFYQPLTQEPLSDSMVVVVRADAAALPSLSGAIQQQLKQVDPSIPAANIRTMPELVAKSVARSRFITMLLGFFAATGLLLTVVGIYGVVAYGVTQRTRELGIRIALGAQLQSVLLLVIRQGIRPVLIGLAIGLTSAFAMVRVLTSQLYQVNATDPLTFILVAIALLFIAAGACYVPARRATKVSPLVALRYE